jgi:diguanylate cyclase (GGDEF)-like protein/PAS domain S-box-containing protein
MTEGIKDQCQDPMDINNIDPSSDDIIMKWDLFRKAPIGVYIIHEGRFKAVNKEFISYTGYSETELLQIDPLDIVSESFRESVKKNAIDMLKLKRDKPYEYLAVTKNGEDIWVVEVVVPTELQGERAVIGFFMDIDRLVSDSVTDALTGLYNRRYFNNNLKAESERSDRYGSYLSLILFDVDYFKKYNDTFGHTEGDKVLSMIGNIIKKCIRQSDSGCRYGGEEFAVILPQSNIDSARVVAEKIRKRVESETAESNDGVTISAGISQYLIKQNLTEFLKNSDSALYKAKESGRNCVIHN